MKTSNNSTKYTTSFCNSLLNLSIEKSHSYALKQTTRHYWMPYRRLSMSRSYPLLSSSLPFYMHSAHYTHSLVLKARLDHVAVRLATDWHSYFLHKTAWSRLTSVGRVSVEHVTGLVPYPYRKSLTFKHRNFLLNFSTPVFKMWIIQEPKKVALWNKRHFKEQKTESVQHV